MTARILLAAAILLGLISFSQAQIGLDKALENAGRLAVAKPPPTRPLEPSGFPPLGPKEGTLPPPRPFGEEERVFDLIFAGKARQSGTKVYATDGFHARYKGYDMFGSTLEGDHRTEIYTLSGDVKVIGRDSVITGRTVTINMKTRSFRAEDAESQLSPTFLKGNVRDYVYSSGRVTEGTEREVHSHDGGITTCNLEHPHFEILANYTTVRPTKRVIMRKVKIILLGKKLIEIPYLAIPLDDRGYQYLPEVGNSPDEGYYIKFKYPIALPGDRDMLNVLFDYMTKRGTGLGLDFRYDKDQRMEGRMRVYAQSGPGTQQVEVTNTHHQRLGKLDILVDNSYQNHSYLLNPENTLLSSRVNLLWNQQTGLSYFRNSNQSNSFKYVQETWSFSDDRNIGDLRTNLNLTYTSNESTFSGGTDVRREQLDVKVTASQNFDAGLAEFEYSRSIPIGEVEGFLGATDRTPVLSFSTGSEKLLGPRFRALPVTLRMSLGEYAQPGLDGERLTRTALDLAFNKSSDPTKRFIVETNALYKQGVYSDGTAQYIMGFNGSARYSLGGSTGINFRYNYLEPHGFTPLAMDRSGEYNDVRLDVAFRPIRSLEVRGGTAYDFKQEQLQQTAWQSIGLSAEWEPTDYFRLRGQSSYDTFSKAWSNVRLDLLYRPGATTVGVGARYDAFRHTWGNVNVFVDGLKTGRLKTSMILVYNGYIKQFEARHFSFIYDLHCAEAIFQIIDQPVGYRPGTQFGFFIRLKAFPFDTPFGTGRRGQSYGTGTGFGY